MSRSAVISNCPWSTWTWWLLLMLVVTTGCVEGVDPQISAAREQFLLAEPPASPQSIGAAKLAVDSSPEITLIGRIEAGDFAALDPHIAAFMLSELPSSDHAHGDGQTADNCPFCKRRAAQAAKAHVVLVDAQGEPIQIPARQLIDLEPGDQVIVSGRGTWNEPLNLLEVKSRGIYPVP